MAYRRFPRVALAAVLAFTAVPATVAFAQDQDAPAAEATPQPGPSERRGPGPRGERGSLMMMERFDRDGDGDLTVEEFAAIGERPVTRFDADGDGVITAEEIDDALLDRMVQRRRERIVERFDLDGNGTIELAEIERLQEKRFALMDRNDDGKVDAKEMRLAREFMGGPGRHDGKRRHAGKGPGWHGKGGDCGPRGAGWHHGGHHGWQNGDGDGRDWHHGRGDGPGWHQGRGDGPRGPSWRDGMVTPQSSETGDTE